jgi:hypothetical protein
MGKKETENSRKEEDRSREEHADMYSHYAYILCSVQLISTAYRKLALSQLQQTVDKNCVRIPQPPSCGLHCSRLFACF